MKLRLAQVVKDTEAEGPGRRFAVWVQGCSLRCPGCCNPEMFAQDKGEAVEVDALVAQLGEVPGLEGVSFLGGEPFEQAAGCAELAKAARALGLSVMIFSGYTKAELEERAAKDAGARELLLAADLLVDGRYDQALPDAKRRWIGSTNQALHFLTSRYSLLDARFHAGNTVELRLEKGRVTINGWPAPADAVRR